MKNKIILPVFAVLLLAAMIPFSFTAGEPFLLFGWLPFSLAYWWVLMFVNLAFVLLVSRHFVKTAERKDGEKK